MSSEQDATGIDMIYLDNNSTTEPDSNMLNAVIDIAKHWYGNPSSPHYYGQVARDIMEQSRESVSRSLGARSSQIVFTSGGTEANNLALHKKSVIHSAVEHHSVTTATVPLDICSVNTDGTLNLDVLEELIKKHSDKKICVSVMYANNETGVILDPLLEIKKLKNKYDFIYHIDAVQALGKGVDIDVDNLGADLLSISGHKIHGLKGIGALYVRDPALIDPLFFGGSQEYGRRPGTENQVGIISLGHMCDKISADVFYQNRILNMAKLRDELEGKLADIATVNGNINHRVVNTSSLSIDAISDLDLFIEILSSMGVYVSGKSACSTGMPKPSQTLSAMFGPDDFRLHNTLRVSLSVNTTSTDIEVACELIREARRNYLNEIGD